jgi:hypothetical protein
VRGIARRAGALVAALAVGPVAAFAEDRGPSREDLERFEWALDRAVRKVSRPSAAPLLGGAEACRGYHINGYGAFFVLAPRALPLRQRSAHEASPHTLFLVPVPPPGSSEREAVEPERRRAGTSDDKTKAREELLAMEARAAALQRAAETTREEGELAMEDLHRRLVSSTLGEQPPVPLVAPVPVVPVVPAEAAAQSPHPPPPVPPWRFWFESEEQEEPRSPERVVTDVRSAVTDVLENHGPPLRLGGDEFVVVVVDFLPRSAFASRTRPARTLVVRVRKGELEARAAGTLASDELRRRIEYSEY